MIHAQFPHHISGNSQKIVSGHDGSNSKKALQEHNLGRAPVDPMVAQQADQARLAEINAQQLAAATQRMEIEPEIRALCESLGPIERGDLNLPKPGVQISDDPTDEQIEFQEKYPAREAELMGSLGLKLLKVYPGIENSGQDAHLYLRDLLIDMLQEAPSESRNRSVFRLMHNLSHVLYTEATYQTEFSPRALAAGTDARVADQHDLSLVSKENLSVAMSLHHKNAGLLAMSLEFYDQSGLSGEDTRFGMASQDPRGHMEAHLERARIAFNDTLAASLV